MFKSQTMKGLNFSILAFCIWKNKRSIDRAMLAQHKNRAFGNFPSSHLFGYIHYIYNPKTPQRIHATIVDYYNTTLPARVRFFRHRGLPQELLWCGYQFHCPIHFQFVLAIFLASVENDWWSLATRCVSHVHGLLPKNLLRLL